MNAKKLKSGKYRARAYDYTDEQGKKHYKSFTSTSKKEAERLATEFMLRHDPTIIKEKITVREAVDRYIEVKAPILDETTLHAYKIYKEYAFQNLMEVYVSKVTNKMLREAVSEEAQRITVKGKVISAKSVKNEYSLIRSSLNMYAPYINTKVPMPRTVKRIVKVPSPENIYNAVKGSNIELAVMLAMWLSFSTSEIKGLKRSSIDGDYIQIDQVMVRVGSRHIEKELAKVDTRTRRHRIPPYIASLIAQLPEDQEYLVPLTGNSLNGRLQKLLAEHDVQPITFHKLRHVNASAMALLKIPDKYAQERGGWKTDSTMKNVYQHTFSEERVLVDDKIDEYFNVVVGIEKPKIKYEDFLKFMNLTDSEKTRELFEELQAQNE